MSPSESHDREIMKPVIVPTYPFTSNPQPTNHESSHLHSHSRISEEPTPSESAPSSPRSPPQHRQVQTHIPQSPTDDDDGGAEPIHPVLKIVDKQELGKAVIVLAVPMVMVLVIIKDPFAQTIEMKVVAVTLCFAFAFISNGILLRKTYRRASAVVLMVGIALMMLSLYAYLGWILPIYLIWIPVACWVLSVFPFATVLVAFICSRMKKKAEVASKERNLKMGEA